MWDEPWVLLVLGFVLTTVVGGSLAMYLQWRTWRNQHEVERRDLTREQALKTFEELSVLLDKRVYRMKLVFWACRRIARGDGDGLSLESRRADYRDVLWQWNDNINRVHAGVQTFFGAPARQRLRDELYDTFEAIGEELDQFLREVNAGEGQHVRIRPIGSRLKDLSDRVYEFDLGLLHALQMERLGSNAQQDGVFGGSIRPFPVRFGMDGDAVRAVQSALVRAGEGLHIDGHFGAETELALMAFQQRNALDADGVAGPHTLRALHAVA